MNAPRPRTAAIGRDFRRCFARSVAVGFQAGSMEIDSCDPAQPVSMLHLHGLVDENVPMDEHYQQ